MTELVVQTITFVPAKVEFNFDQLAGILDGNLAKYQGLEFTEKTAGDCKKTIAELRKGKTLLDTYRKDTKKRLTESVTAFEDQVKLLNAKFDAVINPLSEQYEQFEHDRRERKRQEIQAIINNLIFDQGLNEKYAAQLNAFPEEYFNKGKSIKDIKTELTERANMLGIAQDKEDADREIIKTKVELANARYGVELVETPYVNLLQHEYTIDTIVEKINADAETLKRRTAAVPAAPATPAPATPPATSTASGEKYVERYEITGTEAQLDALETFLKANGYGWKVIE